MISTADSMRHEAYPRTLPIRLAPAPEEAFDSWVERYAARLQVPLVNLIEAIGLIRAPVHDDDQYKDSSNWTTLLRPGEVDRIVQATDLSARLLTGLTLQRFNGVAVDLDLEQRRVRRTRLWARGSGSRFCPACLAETDSCWPLAWRLSWSFCCPRHRVLLVDHCPGCGRVPRSSKPRMLRIPEPGRCNAPAWEPGRGRVLTSGASCCGFDLAASRAQPVEVVEGSLGAQAFVHNVLAYCDSAGAVRAADGTSISPMEVFADLKAVGGAVLTVLAEKDLPQPPQPINQHFGNAGRTSEPRRNPRPGFMAPRGAARMAFAVNKAVEVVAAPDIDTAADRVSWIIDRMRRRGVNITPTSVTRSWGECSQALEAVVLRALDTHLRPTDRLRYRTATLRPRHPQSDSTADGIDTRVVKLPQRLWPAWALRLMPPSRLSFLTFRRVAIACLLLPGSRRGLAELLGDVGNPFPQAFQHVMRVVADSGDGDRIIRTLSALASHLDEAQVPIDYQRRRHLFGSTTLLPDSQWKAFCVRTGEVATEGKRLVAERYLFELLTGSPESPNTPYGFLTTVSGQAYTNFCTTLRPTLAKLLTAAAEQLLIDHAVDEPLVWEPPFEWVDTRAWPGPYIDDVRPADLQRLLIDQQRSLSQAAAALRTSVEHLRLVLVRHPMGPLKRPRAPRRNKRTVRGANLTPEYIAYRYEQCGWSYPTIARDLDADQNLVQRLAAVAGVQSRPQGRAQTHHIDPTWLADQYLRRDRTLADIAAELGMHPNTVSRIARRLELSRRPVRGSRNLHRVGGRPVACAEWIRPAVDPRCGPLRLRRFVTLIEYPTYQEASRALQVTVGVLARQVQRLERDLGVPLLVRAKSMGQPMRLTRAGRKFACDARVALANLQAARASETK